MPFGSTGASPATPQRKGTGNKTAQKKPLENRTDSILIQSGQGARSVDAVRERNGPRKMMTRQIVTQKNSDPDQSAAIAASNHVNMEWKPTAAAPFDCDLELAVTNDDRPHAGLSMPPAPRWMGGCEK